VVGRCSSATLAGHRSPEDALDIEEADEAEGGGGGVEFGDPLIGASKFLAVGALGHPGAKDGVGK
jgi:hypothetical protein